MSTAVILMGGASLIGRTEKTDQVLSALPVHSSTEIWVHRAFFFDRSAMPERFHCSTGVQSRIRYLAAGCLCCDAQQIFRVELIRLRRQRLVPDYLLIDLDPNVDVVATESYLKLPIWTGAYSVIQVLTQDQTA